MQQVDGLQARRRSSIRSSIAHICMVCSILSERATLWRVCRPCAMILLQIIRTWCLKASMTDWLTNLFMHLQWPSLTYIQWNERRNITVLFHSQPNSARIMPVGQCGLQIPPMEKFIIVVWYIGAITIRSVRSIVLMQGH